MSRLVLWNLTSFDGAFEGASKWDLAWHQLVIGPEFERFAANQLRSADRLLFGRVTYEGMAGYWASAAGEIADLMNSVPKFVFTRGRDVTRWANTTVVTGSATDTVRSLKTQGRGDSLVVGSAALSETLIQQDLFDEYRILLAPILLGAGTRLFREGLPKRTLELLEARPLSGGVLVRYAPAWREERGP